MIKWAPVDLVRLVCCTPGRNLTRRLDPTENVSPLQYSWVSPASPSTPVQPVTSGGLSQILGQPSELVSALRTSATSYLMVSYNHENI